MHPDKFWHYMKRYFTVHAYLNSLPVISLPLSNNQQAGAKHTELLGLPVAQCVEHWPADLAVPGFNLDSCGILSDHKEPVFHYDSPIVLI